MPVCPNCKTEFRQRVNGACPSCTEPLQIWKGNAFRESLGSPNVALLETFERLVSKKTSAFQRKPIVYRIPRRTARYTRELVMAEQLLEMCEYDFELASETLDTIFNNKQFRRNHNSLLGIKADFDLARVIALANRAERASADTAQAGYFDRVMERENIFSQ